MHSIHYQYIVSVPSVSSVIRETCSVIWSKLKPIVFLRTISMEKWLQIADQFSVLWQFPHCIGCIDGKHVIIEVSYYKILLIILNYITKFKNLLNYFSVQIMLGRSTTTIKIATVLCFLQFVMGNMYLLWLIMELMGVEAMVEFLRIR